MSGKEANIKAFMPVRQRPDIDDRAVEALAEEKANEANPEPLADDFSAEELAEAEQIRKEKSVAQRAKEKLEEPTPRSEYEHINLGLPAYVMEQLRKTSFTKKRAVRYEVLRGLKRIGYEVKAADLIQDARRKKKK